MSTTTTTTIQSLRGQDFVNGFLAAAEGDEEQAFANEFLRRVGEGDARDLQFYPQIWGWVRRIQPRASRGFGY